jgi:hypothetical protein
MSADASCRIFFSFFYSLSDTKSRLRDVESLADHETSMGHKDQSGGVELKYRAFSNDAEGNLIVDPTLADPVGNDGDDTQRGRCWETLKVLGLAIGIFGYAVGGDVETSKTEETTEGEGSEKEVVKRGSHANCNRCDGGGDTEGDLYCCCG